MQFITLPDHDELPIHCPFCGRKVVDLEAGKPVELCDHVLCLFHGEGIEYQRPDFGGVVDDDEEDSVLEQWCRLELPGAFGFQLGQRVETRFYIVFGP